METTENNISSEAAEIAAQEAAAQAEALAKPDQKAARGKKEKAAKGDAKDDAKVDEVPETVIYKTVEKHTVPFDVMIKGEVINGQWSNSTGYVEFQVPADLCEGFEKHYHFVSGNVAKAV